MKLTLPWLKEHLDTSADDASLINALTALGLEVEDVVDRTAELADFSVAFVKEARQHPNADRLRVCDVETKDGLKQIVCGAPNAKTGMFGIYAPVGSTIPHNGMVLKKSEIRGTESQGMLCSARELGIGEDHDGIIELDHAFEIGTKAAQALGVEGPVIDIGLTPDRADCFGIHGIARDLAAAGLGELKTNEIEPVPAHGRPGPQITAAYPAGDEVACPIFAGRIIRGVKNGPSPAWMQERLKAIGLRPISALVDITNYFMFDMNRPLHVFDAGKLKGDLVLRFARPGEKLLALDDKTYDLDDGMSVIADENGPQALGGIMGGEESGCTDTTTDVLLEVAVFDPVRTAMTGRKLGIESDARTRFERGLDAAYVPVGVERATQMIIDLCGGEAGPVIIHGEVPPHKPAIKFRTNQLQRLAGIDLPTEECRRILTSLGFTLGEGHDVFDVTPPTWRHDVYTEACIVEELARVHGFDHIPPVPVTRTEAVGSGVLTADQRRRNTLRRIMASRGLSEAVTWSFIEEDLARRFGADQPVPLRNPIASELSVMRPSLLPNLLGAAGRNAARKRSDGGLFELGTRFTGSQPGDQVWALAGLRWGQSGPRHWSGERRETDVFDAKADAKAALAAAGVPTGSLQARAEAPDWYHPGRSGVLALGPNVLARFGELHPRLTAQFDLTGRVAAFELDLDRLPKPRTKVGRGRPPIEQWPYPPVDRDFAFVVDQDIAAAALTRAIWGAEKKLVRNVSVFDVYAGKHMDPGKKSIAVAVRLQSKERTLTDKEVEPVAARIIAAAEKQCGASLR